MHRYIVRKGISLLLVAAAPAAVHAQADTVTLAPGPQYGANEIKQTLLGEDYRNLWVTPIRVERLDLGSFAGGLTPTKKGGGLQTRSLRFMGADGREYAFRSVNKYPHLSREPSLQRTPIGNIIQDQVSSQVPAAPVIVPPLAEALGLPHPRPRLVVMPDDPRLGEFREEFAGMLGTIEERADEHGDDGPGFAGFQRIISTNNLYDRLEDSPEDRVDQRAYLTARLLDLVIGDWDRHHDQWRWGRVERNGVNVWVPIPRDRDYAFVNYDGLLMRVGRSFVPNAVRFSEHIDNLTGLTLNARELDRRFLTGLPREVWDSVIVSVQQRLTDEVIDRATQRMPPEFYPQNGPELARRLKARRDYLPKVAVMFYDVLASEVDVRATDERDLALVERTADDVVRVRLYQREKDGDGPRGAPYFDRLFHGADTREVRIYLHGGDDRALVRGNVGESLMVRVIGGGGDDVLVDSSVVHRERRETAFYDHRGDNRFERGDETIVDTREYEAPEATMNLSGESYRDWGTLWTYAPLIGYQSTDGPILGFGPVFTRYGFRREPYKYLLGARGMIGLRTGAVAAEAWGDFKRANSRSGTLFRVRGSQLDPLRFYGFGNDTEPDQPNPYYVVRQDRLLASASWYFGIPETGQVSFGPIAKFTRSQMLPGTPFDRENRFGRDFAQAGGQAEVLLDRRDDLLLPRKGVLVRAGASAYPGLLGAEAPFGEAHATASTYLSPTIPLKPTLALRVGGRWAWGEYPVHEAAFLGGSATVRGYPFQRFAGDAAVFGNAELRMPIAEVKLLARGMLGGILLADAGRVYMDGESPGGWHTAVGVGSSFSFQIRGNMLAFSGIYAQGEKGRVYLNLGLPF